MTVFERTRPVAAIPVHARLRRLLPALVPALLFVPVVWAPPLNHDVAAILSFSGRWIAGERLYTDLIDVNPPLIFVLTAIPAALGRLTGIGGIVALEVCLLAWGALAWVLSVRVRERGAEGIAERVFLDVLPPLFLLAGGYDYGQREHLMAVAALPYLLAAGQRAQGIRPRAAVASALFAAIGFALKPYFLAIPLFAELLVLASRGWRREARDEVPWTMAAVWAAYAAALPVFFPAYLGAVVPMAMRNYLDISDYTPLSVLLVSRLAAILCLFVPVIWLARKAQRTRMLAAGAAGALVSAIAQHKGWSYQIVPVEHFTLATALLLAARWLDRAGAVRTQRTGVQVATALSGMFALYVISNGEAPWKEIDYPHGLVAGLTRILARVAPGQRVLVMSPGIYPVYPALNYAGADMALPTMNMWMLEGSYQSCLPDGRRYRDPSGMGEAEAMVFRGVPESVARDPPAAIVVDRQPGIPWCGSEFDFIAYFSRNPLFAAAFSQYRLDSEWDRYRIYVRR